MPYQDFGLSLADVMDGACRRIASPFLASPDPLPRWVSFYRSEISLSPLSTHGGHGGRTHRQLCEILLLKGPATPRVALRSRTDCGLDCDIFEVPFSKSEPAEVVVSQIIKE